jgi:CheY-like chemotaxis protein
MNAASEHTSPLVAIIDDEEDITTYLEMALTDAGYRVVAVNEAARALEILRREPPDLICLDLLMPQRTGASLLREIGHDKSLLHAPVLVLSGLNARDELKEILRLDDTDPLRIAYLEKPLETESFLQLVEQLLAGPDTLTGSGPS